MNRASRVRDLMVLLIVLAGAGPWWVSHAQAMKTLESERVTCGQMIVKSLRVANNLDCAGSIESAGLKVAAPNITIDLGGHRISGDGDAGDFGIDNSGGHNGVVVRNGVVAGFEHGVFLDGATRNVLKGLHVLDNEGIGINLDSSSNNTLKGNTVSGNDSSGIDLSSSSTNNILVGNATLGNGGSGVLISSSSINILEDNRTSGNVHGISLQSSSSNNVLRGNSASGNALEGIRLSVSPNNKLKGNKASANGANGISVSFSDDNVLKANRASGNDTDGITLEFSGDIVLRENVANENGDDGISSNSAGLTIVANTTNRNGFFNGVEGGNGLGINVPSGTTNSKNKAKGNDDPNQCEAADVNCHVA